MGRRISPRQKNPLIVICSEGNKKSAEVAYFKNFRNRNLRIEFVDGEETDPKGMLDKCLRYLKKIDFENEDEAYCYLVLDTDLNKDRINMIKEIESICYENNIKIITSAPTFEIWFLLHKRNNNITFANSKEVKKATKKEFNGYSEGINIYNEIKDYTTNAINNAKNLEKNSLGDKYEINPHSNIYEIIEVILSKIK